MTIYKIVNNEEIIFRPTDNAEQIVLSGFTYSANRMGSAPIISSTLNYPICLDNYWDDNVYVNYKGERYFLKQIPTSTYNSDSVIYKHDLEFVSERVALENVYFYDVVDADFDDDKPVSNKSDFSFSGTIHEFAERLNQSLQYAGLEYRVVVDEGIETDDKLISVEHEFFSAVLQEAYNTYEVPYYFEGKTIHIGFTGNAINEVFAYGVNDALMSITKNNAGNRIINRVTGLGSEDNIPYYYPNLSPKGDIEAVVNSGGLTIADVTIVDYKAFSDSVELNDSIVYNIKPIEGFRTSVNHNLNTTGNPYNIHIYAQPDKNKDTRFISIPIELTYYIEADNADVSNETAIQVKPTLDLVATWNKYNIPTDIDTTVAPEFTLTLDRVRWTADSIDVKDSIRDLTPDSVDGWYVLPKYGDWKNKYGHNDSCRVVAYYTLQCHTYANYDGSPVWDMAGKGYWSYNDNKINLTDIGLKINVNANIADGDTITQSLVQYINPQKYLMPPKYRYTQGAERFYNALNDTYQNPEEDAGVCYEFENPFVEGRPKEQIVQFEEIKPTIKEVKNSNGLRIDMFSEFAYDRDDNDEIYEDENGKSNYTHPYFFGKLRKLDFNLFDSAIEEGEMTIAMTSGKCGACEFIVGVDADEKFNTVQVDDNGDLIYDENGNVLCGREDFQSEVDAQPRQQDTINNEVWIALRKDTKTFGELMPNATNNYRPTACTQGQNDGDTFVILHINLPQLYITKAEETLEEQIIRFMYDNNFEKFNFSIKFSRIYLAEHPEILNALDENARITIEYNGQQHLLYVSSYTYKVDSDNVLPEISVELKDELSVSQNAVQRAVNKAVAEVYKTIGNIDVVAQGSPYFLRKDVPDTAEQQITFNKQPILKNGATIKEGAIKSDDYYSDLRGLAIYKDSANNWHVETDYLNARKKFTAKEVEIQKVRHISGAQIKSSASMICSRVEDAGDAYRCYFNTTDADGNTIYNEFVEGDQAYVQTFNLVTDDNGNSTNHFYWRLVTGVGEDFILLSKTACIDGSTTPMAGDNIVQLGCQDGSREDRMVAVIDAGAGEGAPYYRQYVGIRSFELPEPETQLKPNDNIISGKIIFQEGSYGLSKTAEWGSIQQMGVTANQALIAAGEVADELSSTQDYIDELNGEIGTLNKRLDGVIENYFYEGTPTTYNYPASSWVTNAEKIDHIGDTYTNINEYQNADGSIKDANAGKSWRWCQCTDETITDYVEVEDNNGNNYRLHWHPIADSDAVLALQKAANAQNTADKKIRTFVVQPTPPYAVGDFWYDGDTRLKVCITARATGSFNANDWVTADSLQRYGQNIVKGTGTPIKKETHWDSGYDWYSYPTSCVLLHKLEKGKTYTVTCQTTGEWSNAHNPSVQSNKVTLWISDLTNYSVIISDVNTSTGTTFVWDRDYFEGYPQKIRFNTYGKPQQFWNLKIEEGDTATPWSLAPEEQSVVYHNISSEAPIDAKEGDMWIPSDASHTTYTYTNGAWVISGDSTGTTINNGLVTSGTIQLGDPNATAKAGITGAGNSDESVRIWAGSAETTKNNAPFRVLQDGTIYAYRGVFGGLLSRSKFVLDANNINDYLITKYGFTYVDLTKTGTFVECKVGNTYLILNGYNDDDTNQDYINECRGLVGNKIIICNTSNSYINVTGRTVQETLSVSSNKVIKEYSPSSPTLPPNYCLCAECKLITGTDNQTENVVWVWERFKMVNP